MFFTMATVPGSPETPNEDWLATTPDLLVVLDGGTVRTETGCRHGAAWYARKLGAVSDCSYLLSYLLLGDAPLSWTPRRTASRPGQISGQRVRSDPAQRQNLFRDAAAQLTADVAGIPLTHSRVVVALRGVTGFTPDPLEKTLLTPTAGPRRRMTEAAGRSG